MDDNNAVSVEGSTDMDVVAPFESLHVIDHKVMRKLWHRYKAHLAFWSSRRLRLTTVPTLRVPSVILVGDTNGHDLLCAHFPNVGVPLPGCKCFHDEADSQDNVGDVSRDWELNDRVRPRQKRVPTRFGVQQKWMLEDETRVPAPERLDSWVSEYYLELYEWGRDK